MTLAQLKTTLETSGYPVAYRAFPEADAPAMPFICYMATTTDNFGADGKVYEVVQFVEVQLFTEHKDLAAEANLEAALADVFWQKDEELIEDELCYRIIYTITL